MMKWIVLSLGAALLLAGGALALFFQSGQKPAQPSSQERYYKEAYERLSAKYAYLKRKNELLAEKISRDKRAVRRFRKDCVSQMSTLLKRRGVLRRQGGLPFAGTPALAMTLMESRSFLCAHFRRTQELERDILGFETGEEAPVPALCGDPGGTAGEDLLEELAASALRYRGAENNASVLASLWRKSANDLLAFLEEDSVERKKRVLDYYATMPEKLALPGAVEESLSETLAYWRTVYGL